MAVDDLAVQERALEVRGGEVNAAHGAALAGGVTEEGARGAVAQRRGEGLIEVDAVLEGAPLHAETNLDLPVALDLVHPHKLVDPTPAGHVAALDELPRSVARVVAQLDALAVLPLGIARGGIH